MVRVIILAAFVGALAFTPIWLFDQIVVPELLSLKDVYGNADATAQHVIEDQPVTLQK